MESRLIFQAARLFYSSLSLNPAFCGIFSFFERISEECAFGAAKKHSFREIFLIKTKLKGEEIAEGIDSKRKTVLHLLSP